MALQVNGLERVFMHDKIMLTDPDPNMSPEEVMKFYTNTYPELTTSNVHGPEVNGDRVVYKFKTTVGTKG